MYDKTLNESIRLRLSKKDLEFLQGLSDEREVSVSECIRFIIGEYRRSLKSIEMFQQALDLAKKGASVHGDKDTDFDNQL